MAILTTSKVASTVQPRANLGVNSVTGTYTLTAALALNDVIQMVKIPSGATVLDTILSCNDLDTGGAPTITLSVGDGGSTARYLSASTIGQTGGLAHTATHGGHGYAYTADDTIDVLVAAAPATGATTGTVALTVIYTLDA